MTNTTRPAEEGGRNRAAERDALLQASLDFISRLTGMVPPPIEVAPPEVFAPFHAFVDRVQAITDGPGPADFGRAQHARDSAELRRLCAERDHARRERDLQKVEVAALTSTVANLSRLVDELRPGHDRYEFLRGQDLDAIERGGVFAGKTPDNLVLNGETLDATIDAARAAQAQGGEHG